MALTFNERLLALHRKVVEHFNSGNWAELGLLTDQSEAIDRHPRLLRSLSFGDDDYSGNALVMLKKIATLNPNGLDILEKYMASNYPEEGAYVSSLPAARKITFAPNVFQVPDKLPESDLVAVMMPFQHEFAPVYAAIKYACDWSAMKCLRADDIWDNMTIIQDIFDLIFRAEVVVVDFSGKNPNVMYETGIAHTLGKHVIPITQSLDDVPFDIRHHRVLKYLPNAEGLDALKTALGSKLSAISGY